MFRYYNYTLIESNRSYSTEKVQRLLGIHPQTIREWISKNGLNAISTKPILIHGGILKAFIKNRNESHRKTLNFNEFKCLKCKAISIPQDNQISIYHNKNGSIRAIGICPKCDNQFYKLYKKNSIDELKNAFFVKLTESTLYNTSSINSKTNEESKNKVVSSELENNEIKEKKNNKETIKAEINCKTNIKESKTSSKTNIKTKQQGLFDFDYD